MKTKPLIQEYSHEMIGTLTYVGDKIFQMECFTFFKINVLDKDRVTINSDNLLNRICIHVDDIAFEYAKRFLRDGELLTREEILKRNF